jgi:hypothetical protein
LPLNFLLWEFDQLASRFQTDATQVVCQMAVPNTHKTQNVACIGFFKVHHHHSPFKSASGFTNPPLAHISGIA